MEITLVLIQNFHQMSDFLVFVTASAGLFSPFLCPIPGTPFSRYVFCTASMSILSLFLDVVEPFEITSNRHLESISIVRDMCTPKIDLQS